jgi:uncharacterized phiE125 gp8 family phage protein
MMNSGWTVTVVTPAPVEPVDLETVKTQARIDTNEDDDFIENIIIPTARDRAQQYLRRSLIDTVVDITWDGFPWYRIDQAFFVPWAPIKAIHSISFRDSYDVVTTLSSTQYRLEAGNEPARIVPSYGNLWPNTSGGIGAVTVRAIAGYPHVLGNIAPPGSPTPTPEQYRANIPPSIIHAILMDAAHLYNNREAVSEMVGGSLVNTPLGWESLLSQYRLMV